MIVAVRTVNKVTLIEAEGAIDTRSAAEFERSIQECLGKGESRFVVDLSKVELISSAGLRVLVMLAKRVAQGEGTLVLCGFCEHVRTVFEVTGLIDHFTIVDTQAQAMARVSAPMTITAHAKLSELVGRLTAVGLPPVPSRFGTGDKPVGDRDTARLAERVAELLARADQPKRR